MTKMSNDIEIIKRLVSTSSEATRHASTIAEQDLDELEAALRISFVAVTDGATEEAASQSIASDLTEFAWEANKHEAKHRDEYLEILERQVDLPPHLVWSKRTDKTDTLKTSMHAGGASLPFRIGCRTDALVVATAFKMAEEGSIVATVELKKKVVLQSLRQTKATYVCASLKSQLPVISCVTDMKEAGIAYYTAGQRRTDGTVICVERFFKNAADMMQWLHKALSRESVPADVLRLRSDEVVLPEELRNPKRVRLPVPPPTRRAAGSEWQDILARIFGGDDVANLAELREFESLSGDHDATASLSYYS